MIVQKSSQNVNSNAGVFLAKQLLDRMGGFSRFDDFLSAMSPSCPGTPDGLAFVVKRNPRGESAGRWLEQAKGNSDGPSEAYRNDKRGADVSVWRGVVSHVKTKSTQDRPLFCVYEVVETKADDIEEHRNRTRTCVRGGSVRPATRS